VQEVKNRPEDGMTDGEKLTPGGQVPAYRKWLKEAKP
jgi:hypothetical protein